MHTAEERTRLLKDSSHDSSFALALTFCVGSYASSPVNDVRSVRPSTTVA